ncbi:MAG: gliding motility lipoprotein GldH [Saprospiraceae bacterium]|nr:gliding motility lipoprotein GldH [Saprospiraceae bacterium]MDW8229703.1 gliding motility lipoprotein GldH [Saprospiraceae bacterium]
MTEPTASWGCVPTTLIGLGAALVLLWLLAGCGRAPFYEQEAPIEEGCWAYDDTVRFSFSVADTSLRYNLYLSVEHADTFPYQNIYVQIHTTYPDGQRFVKLLPLDLFDATGQPNGACSGGVCSTEFVLQKRAILPQVGQYVIAVEQYMRYSPVAGIRALRLRIEPPAAASEGR